MSTYDKLVMDVYNILTIDTETANLDALRRTLNPEYNVFSATSFEDAFATMEKKDIALVLADTHIPGMTGMKFMKKVQRRYPDTIRIIITEYTDQKLTMDAINAGYVHDFLNKPWDMEEVKDIVREGIEVYERTLAYREPHIRDLLDSETISVEQLSNALRICRTERYSVGDILVELGKISEDQLHMVMEVQRAKREKLGKILVDIGLVSLDDLQTAYERRNHMRKSLLEILADMEYINQEYVLEYYALQLGMPAVSLSQFSIGQELTELIPSELSYKYSAIPVDIVGQVLVVVAPEPLTERAISEIKAATGYRIMVAYAPRSEIETALEQSNESSIEFQQKSYLNLVQ